MAPGAAARARLGARAATEAITGRVPLLLLLGVAALVAAAPGRGHGGLWVLAVLAARRRSTCCSRRSPAGSRVTRRPVGPGAAGRAAEHRPAGRQHRRPAGPRRAARRLAAVRRRDRQPAPARPRRPATRSRLTHPADARPGAATGAPTGSRCAAPGRSGLAARQRVGRRAGTVRVLPPFHSRKHLPSRLARLRELDGRAAVRVRGQGTEFDSLREYVRGDDVRSIDWRASARTRNVVVRTWQPERHRRVLLVLDTSRTSAGPRRRRTPAGLRDGRRAAARRAGRPGRGPRRLPGRRPAGAGPGPRQAPRRRAAAAGQDAMADLEPVLAEADWSRLTARGRRARPPAGARRAAHRRSSRPPSSRACCRRCRPSPTGTGWCWPRCATPSSTGWPPRRGDPDRGVRRGRRRAGAGRPAPAPPSCSAASGVDVVDADADRLPVALTDHYLMLKGRGLL